VSRVGIATRKGNFRDPMAPIDEEVFESYKREMKSLQTMKSIQSMPTAETQSSHRTIQSECRLVSDLSPLLVLWMLVTKNIGINFRMLII